MYYRAVVDRTGLIVCWIDLSYSSVGLKASLERLQLEYVDVVFANRPDPNTPMEGTSQSQFICSTVTHPFCLCSRYN